MERGSSEFTDVLQLLYLKDPLGGSEYDSLRKQNPAAHSFCFTVIPALYKNITSHSSLTALILPIWIMM